MLADLLAVVGFVPLKEYPPVHLWVQSFYAPSEHFRPACQIGNVAHRNPGLTQELGCSSGRDDFNSQGRESAREPHDSRLVVNTDERSLDRQSKSSPGAIPAG